MKKLYFLFLLLAFCALLALAASAADGSSAASEVNPVLVGVIVGVAAGLVSAGVALFFMCRSMNTVRKEKSADGYIADGSFELEECRDVFLYSHVTRIRVNNNNKR